MSPSPMGQIWVYPPVATGPAPGLAPFMVFNVFAYGAKGDGTTDDSAAIQAAYNAAVSAGSGVVWFPGGYTYLLNSATIKITRSTTKWIGLWGYGATIKLSATAPRFLDFNKVADYDSFNYLDLRGLTVDGTNIPNGTGHVVLGTYAGTQQNRISVQHVHLTDVSTVNVPVDSTMTKHCLNVWIVPRFGPYDTQGTVSDIRVTNCRFSGGNQGVVAGATVNPSGQQQTLSIPTAVSSGDFGLTFNGFTVLNNAYNILAATLQTNFQGLSSVGSGNCTVSGPVVVGSNNVYTFTFAGALAGMVQPAISVDSTNGGSGGLVGGTATAAIITATTDYANCLVDDIEFSDCWHSLLAAQSASFSSNNFQIGSQGFGGRWRILRCYGQYSGDVGVEIDSGQDVIVEDVTIDDAYNIGLYQTNSFANPQNPNGQMVVFNRCAARQFTASTVHALSSGYPLSRPVGYFISTSFNWSQAENVHLIDCVYYRNCNDVTRTAEALCIQGGNHVEVIRFNPTIEGINYSGVTNYNSSLMSIAPLVANQVMNVVFRDCHPVVSGATPGAGIVTYWLLNLENPNAVSGIVIHLTVDGFYPDFNVSSFASTGCRFFKVSGNPYSPSTAFTLYPSFRRVVPRSFSGSTAPDVFLLYGSSQVALSEMFVEDCDFTALPAGANEFVFTGSGTSAALSIIARNNKWRVFPKAAAVISPTGSPFTYQNADMYDERVSVYGGSTTEIDLAVDGSTFVNTGLTSGQFLLASGEALKVTYPSGAPTMEKWPVK